MNVVRMYGLSREKELQKISIPKEARILSVCVVHEHIQIAVEEEVNAFFHKNEYQTIEFAIFNENRHFHVDGYTFLGTILLEFGNTIYHVFYRNI